MNAPAPVRELMEGQGFSEAAASELLLPASWELEEEIYGEVLTSEEKTTWSQLLPDCAPAVDDGGFRLRYIAGEALHGVLCSMGEHIVQNKVYLGGVCGLRVVRLGQPVNAEHYLEQMPAVSELQAWRWVDQRSGQDMHTLLILWRL